MFQSAKRLIPHLFEYSHTFFGIIILLHVCSFSPVLEPLLDSPANRETIEFSKAMFLEWLRDMQVVHPIAHWCWQLIRAVHKDHPTVKDS